MHLRPARAADLPLLNAIAQRAKAHWGYPPSALEAWRDELTITEGDLHRTRMVVAEAEGELAGCCGVAGDGDDWSLEHVWVSPDSMGQGVGRALLRHALAAAKRAGAKRLHVDADPNAEGFYARMGGVRVGEVAAPIEGQPGRKRPQLVFELERGPAADP